MPKGLCNAPTAAKLRKGIGFMQMVPDLHMMLAWMSGPMMKTFMMLATQKWYVTVSTILLNYLCLLKRLDFLLVFCVGYMPFSTGFSYISMCTADA
jgi:hypothetical protein